MKMPQAIVGFVMLISSIFLSNSGSRGGGSESSSPASFVIPEAVFAFGDSLSDTGNDAAAFPGAKPALHYGQTYFGKFVGRACDGRLIIDFLAQSFNLPLLSPYLQGLESDYTHGANFAVRGATARNTAIVTPFFLEVQINQMAHFRERVLASSRANVTLFSTALYVIHIGINDFWQNLSVNRLTIQQINATIVPQMIQVVSKALEKLYEEIGARSFLVVNVPAVGCLPVILSDFGSSSPEDYDKSGCLRAYNDVVELYNAKLRVFLLSFRDKFSQAQVFLGDVFHFNKDVVANPQQYGFSPDTKLSACCGGGGKLHEPVKQCGVPGTPVCDSPASHISWDGIHFTDSFNRVAASAILGSISSL